MAIFPAGTTYYTEMKPTKCRKKPHNDDGLVGGRNKSDDFLVLLQRTIIVEYSKATSKNHIS